MVRAYEVLINAPKAKVEGQKFNAGYENQSVLELANTVKEVVGSDVQLQEVPTDVKPKKL